MKKVLLLIACAGLVVFSCATPEKAITKKTDDVTQASDSIRIADDDGYEIIIFEPGFNAWLVGNAQPRQYYSKQFLRTRNILFVTEWNLRVIDPSRYDANLYQQQIDFRPSVDYGYEVNYLLYYYFIYFQRQYKQKLGVFPARL
ncbi:DUF6146 family protein [Kordia jejudonensis]|uniref:DUF6146 family protein n=1 Tax=Kordia jejudonensis TaxID=1348245 RepID=UPI000629D16E|nr:DUF6146 family protein [Kordia jejudonensis]